jgi:SAM-dependent methyltransferase
MRLVRSVHGRMVFQRRAAVLARHIADLLPKCQSVLDVGCGDGSIAQAVALRRPELTLTGIDVFVRPDAHIPVRVFDGRRIPYEPKSQDVVMFIDVLHHTDDPMALLAEAARVARVAILVKDHTRNTWMAGRILRFMDWVGNRAHSVRLPYQFWSAQRWRQAWDSLGLQPVQYRSKLGLYPAWSRPLFETNLHFIAVLAMPGDSAR